MIRKLNKEEKEFIAFLIEVSGKTVPIPEEGISMNDGGMGSITFDFLGKNRRYDKIVAGYFNDKDRVLVDFELTIDSLGNLFELDLWKVNFSTLLSLPKKEEIKITSPKNSY